MLAWVQKCQRQGSQASLNKSCGRWEPVPLGHGWGGRPGERMQSAAWLRRCERLIVTTARRLIVCLYKKHIYITCLVVVAALLYLCWALLSLHDDGWVRGGIGRFLAVLSTGKPFISLGRAINIKVLPSADFLWEYGMTTCNWSKDVK